MRAADLPSTAGSTAETSERRPRPSAPSPVIDWARRAALPVAIIYLVNDWSSGLRDGLALAVALWLLCAPGRVRTVLRTTPPVVWFLAWAGWSLLSVLWADHIVIALRDGLKFVPVVAGTFALAALLHPQATVDRVLLWIMVGLALAFSVDAGLWLAGLGAQAEGSVRWEAARAFQHPNTYSGLIVASLPLAFLRLCDRQSPRWAKAVAVVQCATAALLLWAFASRTAQVALVASTALGLILLLGRWGLLATALLISLSTVAAPRFNPRFTEPSMSNLTHRFEVWEGTLELIREHPVIGHGWGMRNFSTTYYARHPERSEEFWHPHDLGLEIAYGSGLVGLSLFGAAWVSLARALVRLRAGGDVAARRLASTLLVSLGASLVFSLADSPHGAYWIFLWTVFGIAAGLTSRGATPQTPAAPPDPVNA